MCRLNFCLTSGFDLFYGDPVTNLCLNVLTGMLQFALSHPVLEKQMAAETKL